MQKTPRRAGSGLPPRRLLVLTLACLSLSETLRVNGQAIAVRLATIPVERIRGPVLLISGGDDQLWPSTVLAESVLKRLRSHRRPFADRHLSYKSAGHLIGKAPLPAGATVIAGGRLATGGTPQANARAQADIVA